VLNTIFSLFLLYFLLYLCHGRQLKSNSIGRGDSDPNHYILFASIKPYRAPSSFKLSQNLLYRNKTRTPRSRESGSPPDILRRHRLLPFLAVKLGLREWNVSTRRAAATIRGGFVVGCVLSASHFYATSPLHSLSGSRVPLNSERLDGKSLGTADRICL